MFGINPSEFIVLVVVAAVVLGPERLPEYAQQLARLVRELRRMAQGASAQVRDELGPEFDDIDWRKLDPRQYDPRRIVREALSDVWDPEDPLGLKGDPLGLKGDPLGLKDDLRGLKDDPLGWKDARAGRDADSGLAGAPATAADSGMTADSGMAADLGTAWDGEKAQSAGGPAATTPISSRWGEAGDPLVNDVPAATAPTVFDPDAT